jgi:hypothetical protein
MDPDLALENMRSALRLMHSDDASPPRRFRAAIAATEHAQALDDWLSRGGYLPAEWQRHQPTHEWMRGQPAHNPSRGVFGADKWGRTPR